ncbi:MAG: glycoside hydrolase family 57 protein [Candidatus Omnitrophota bacterium]|jgi:alpha-amylase/alpha-mannosidase (GH57 family)
MLYLAIIFHMHQPYYKNLLTGESPLPWVRLHGTKDYLDMVEILDDFPAIRQTFNIVPSLIEQVEDYTNNRVKDAFLELSYKKAETLTEEEKVFLLKNFFSINKERVISLFPRYYELYFKHQKSLDFNTQDYLDLQVLFNLAWIDPLFRQKYEALNSIVRKGRFFSEEEKCAVLDTQLSILKGIIPGYKKAAERGQVEFSVTPYYHPILPLLATTNSAKEANLRSRLPIEEFKYPQDAKEQVDSAVKFYQERFGIAPAGMWPSEESVSEKILPCIIESGINWIVTDEAILFKSLKKKKRDSDLLYQPHLLKRKAGDLNVIFRDRNLSDLIGFAYHNWKAENAVSDFINHLENINKTFKGKDILVTIAMDGENAWEYFSNDGHDFLRLLYERLSESKTIKTTTVSQYLNNNPAKSQIKHLATGSWIYGNFDKWMNNPAKTKAWDWLLTARRDTEKSLTDLENTEEKRKLILKQIHILEGSDWFWWYGEDPDGSFDRLFRMHLTNLYKLLEKDPPAYLRK